MKKKHQEILKILERTYRGMSTALNFSTPFQLLISTMLAAQSTDTRVNIVTRDLFRNYPDAQALAQLSLKELEEAIKTVGLYRLKSKNILATSKIISENYDGQIPETREELMALPGVGRKTANVVLSISKNYPAIAVDTHVFRVSNRTGLAKAKNVLETEKQLMNSIPQHQWAAAHHWLIWHGRKICKARNPFCPECSLKSWCDYYHTHKLNFNKSSKSKSARKR